MDWKRFTLILAAGASLGLVWNACERARHRARPERLRAGRRRARGGAGREDAARQGRALPRRAPARLLRDEPHPRRAAPARGGLRRGLRGARGPRCAGELDIVVYCSGYGCEASHIVARKLRERGIHAAILDEGWPAWRTRATARQGAAPVRLLAIPRVQLALRLLLGRDLRLREPRQDREPGRASRKIVYQWQVGGARALEPGRGDAALGRAPGGPAADRRRLAARGRARGRAACSWSSWPPRRRCSPAASTSRTAAASRSRTRRPTRPARRLDEGRRLVPGHAQPAAARRGHAPSRSRVSRGADSLRERGNACPPAE